MHGQTSYWTSGTAEGVSASVGTWGHRTPCTWVEAGKAPWSAEAGLSTASVGGSTALVADSTALVGGSTSGVGGSTALVGGSTAGVGGSIASVGGSTAGVGGSTASLGGSTAVGEHTASASAETFWAGCALEAERHRSEEGWSLRGTLPRRTSCPVHTHPTLTLPWWLH